MPTAEDRYEPWRCIRADIEPPDRLRDVLPWMLRALLELIHAVYALHSPRQLISIDLSSGDHQLPSTSKAFRVGTTAGDLVVMPVDGADWITIPGVQVGEEVRVQATAVRDTSTAAGITAYL